MKNKFYIVRSFDDYILFKERPSYDKFIYCAWVTEDGDRGEPITEEEVIRMIGRRMYESERLLRVKVKFETDFD